MDREPGGLQYIGLQRVGHDRSDRALTPIYTGPYFKKTCYLLNKLILGVIYFFKHVYPNVHRSTVYDS